MNLVSNFQSFPPMTLNHLKHRIKHIDDKYPWSMSPNILLAILLIALLMGLVVVGYFLFRIYKMRSHLRSLKDFKNFLNGTADVSQLNDLRTQIKNLLSPSRFTETIAWWTNNYSRKTRGTLTNTTS